MVLSSSRPGTSRTLSREPRGGSRESGRPSPLSTSRSTTFSARRLGAPLYALLGLDPRKTPVTSYTIGIDTPEIVAEKIREAEGFPVLKIKMGLENDREIMETVRARTDRPVRIDANEGWTRDEALEKMRWLEGLNVELVEQPLPAADLEGVRWLAARTSIPIFADESVRVASDVPKLAGAFHGINIKLMKCGGIREALRMIHTARACGMKVMLGCMIESSIGITAAAHLSPLADYADLDGNLLIRNDPAAGVTTLNGKLVLPEGPGLGVSAQGRPGRERSRAPACSMRAARIRLSASSTRPAEYSNRHRRVRPRIIEDDPSRAFDAELLEGERVHGRLRPVDLHPLARALRRYVVRLVIDERPAAILLEEKIDPPLDEVPLPGHGEGHLAEAARRTRRPRDEIGPERGRGDELELGDGVLDSEPGGDRRRQGARGTRIRKIGELHDPVKRRSEEKQPVAGRAVCVGACRGIARTGRRGKIDGRRRRERLAAQLRWGEHERRLRRFGEEPLSRENPFGSFPRGFRRGLPRGLREPRERTRLPAQGRQG